MPAALDLPWEAIKTLCFAIGVRPALRQMGIEHHEDAVYQRAKREGWQLRNVPRNLPVPPTVKQPVSLVRSPQEALRAELSELNAKSRLGIARGLAKGAEHISQMDGETIVEEAANVKQTVQSLALTHSWNANQPVTKVSLSITGAHEVSVEATAEAIDAEWSDETDGHSESADGP